jgi:OOP family OmpA-OmpF porin
MGGIPIVPSASITFELTFATGSLKPALEAARVERERARVQEAAAPITNEGCKTRLKVMTETNAIYFRTASAELDRNSEPLLDAGAEFAGRCPSVRFVVEGHTDSIGSRAYNQRLSVQRAGAVVRYLATKGIDAGRIQSAGYGDTRPVAPNNSETNRARNRRIEFKVLAN